MDHENSSEWPEWAGAFLEMYAFAGKVSKAVRMVNESKRFSLGYSTVWHLAERSESFKKAMAYAIEEFSDSLFVECAIRGRDGWEEPVIYQGRLCGTWVDANNLPIPEGVPLNQVPEAKFVPLTVNKRSDAMLKLAIEMTIGKPREQVSPAPAIAPMFLGVGVPIQLGHEGQHQPEAIGITVDDAMTTYHSTFIEASHVNMQHSAGEETAVPGDNLPKDHP